MSRARSRALSFRGTGPLFLHPILAPRTLASQDLLGTNMNILGTSVVAQMVKNLPAMWETWVRSLDREDPLEKAMATHSSILAWRIPTDKGAWQATVLGVAKSWT